MKFSYLHPFLHFATDRSDQLMPSYQKKLSLSITTRLGVDGFKHMAFVVCSL